MKLIIFHKNPKVPLPLICKALKWIALGPNGPVYRIKSQYNVTLETWVPWIGASFTWTKSS